jgi:hypothetical protein
MTTKHTPGPWKRIELMLVDGRFYEQIVADGRGVVCLDYHAKHKTEGKANARLIAAAPTMAEEIERLKAINAELLAALRGMLEPESLPPRGTFQRAERKDRARRAIRNATEGES